MNQLFIVVVVIAVIAFAIWFYTNKDNFRSRRGGRIMRGSRAGGRRLAPFRGRRFLRHRRRRPSWYYNIGYRYPWWYTPLYYSNIPNISVDSESDKCFIYYKRNIDRGMDKEDAKEKLIDCLEYKWRVDLD